MYFECADLDRTVAHLKEKDLVFWQDPTDMDYLWREARLKDPDGHAIRLYFADDNRLNPPPGNPCMHRADKQSYRLVSVLSPTDNAHR